MFLLQISHTLSEECRSRPLGLMDKSIHDWQLAASSVVSRAMDPDCAVKNARLYASAKKAWCPEHRKENEWILVDLGVQSKVAKFSFQNMYWTYYEVSVALKNQSKTYM